MLNVPIINHQSSISNRRISVARRGRAAARILLLGAVPILAGCRGAGPLEFRLNTEGRDPSKISLAQREAIVETLTRLFGTPDEPKVPEGVNLRLDLLRTAAGPIGRDAQGNRRGLYRRYCAACHGISGEGAGPLAALLSPYPRDFRTAVYKYTSTAYGAKPTWSDLDRALRRGNPDTAMPSFDLLPQEEVSALVEYAKYLSIRGETELYLLQLVVDEDEYLPLDMALVMEEGVLRTVRPWAEAAEKVVRPPDAPPTDTAEQRAASISAGRGLYLSERAKCFQCHGFDGRGDGEQSELYDDWNTPKINRDPGWFALPVERLRPRDFTRGVFHGGSRPIDIYWRVHKGIGGTPMPPTGPGAGSVGALTPEEIWHVVNYVRSLGRHKVTASGGTELP